MGIGFDFGDVLANKLMKQKAYCLKCNEEITFEDGASYAKDKGINDNVVMCKKCNSVFEVHIVPGRMTLTSDVTMKYKIK